MTRQPDTGETTAAIIARGDDRYWPEVQGQLEDGATLLRVPKLKRAYADFGHGPRGPGISEGRLRKLEREGILRMVGVYRYGLAQSDEHQ